MQDNFMTNLKLMSTGVIISKIPVIVSLIIFLTFNLARAELTVRRILFEGNQNIKSTELKSILKTRVKKEFDTKLYRIDKIILKNYYLTEGFLNVWVESEVERQGNMVDIIYKISEGKRYFLETINFSGNSILPSTGIREFFNNKNGAPFRTAEIENGLNALEDYYFNHGKPYVELSVEQTTGDSLITVEIRIKENETVYIEDIDYQGLQQVQSFVIRRELEIQKDDIYSRQKIEKSQRNIYSTGLFDYVNMDLRAVDSTRSHARLVIRVVEKKSKWVGVRFGLGYEQEIVYGGTFDFTVEFGHRNLFGTARSVYLNAGPSFSYDFNTNRITNPKNQYSFNFVEPWIGYTRTPGIFRISFIQARPLNSAHYDYFTSAFFVQHDFENYWKISGGVAYNRVQILEGDSLDPDFYKLTQGQDFIYSVSSRLIRDHRDNYLNPHNGSILDYNGKIALSQTRDNKTGKISNSQFLKLIFEWDRYQPINFKKNWTLATRIKSGNIFTLARNILIPISERFYLGGASTVRGYPEQLLGPVFYDENNENPKARGGKFMLLSNIEFRIPLFWLFVGETFLDGGNVWLDARDLQINDIRFSTGTGLAILTPLGPVRFDYGFKLRREKQESPGEFHISIAFAF